VRYIRTNNPQSAYALHILQNRHEYGPIVDTLQLLKTCSKGTHMNGWEALYMQTLHQNGILIAEQGTLGNTTQHGKNKFTSVQKA